MTVFEKVKTAVTARQAAEMYGIEVRSNGMTNCPFHEDHNPSMKLDQNFYCFGCHAHGDVIDFTARLFGINRHSTAVKLAEDFGREVTIRDLLSHASGLQQGVAGMIAMMKHSKKDTLEQRIDAYSRYCLDFQPGTATSYSPCAAFDVLGYLIGKVTGKNVADAYRELVFEPLGMESATFRLVDKSNLAKTYTRKKEKLVDITGTSKDLEGILRIEPDSNYVAGCGGLYCTVKDYEKLARMLCNEGDGFLKPETVALMATEAQGRHLEPEPGQVWGLSVRIRQKDKFCTPGTYGWSGALGTYFFVSPKDKLEAVFATHRSDLGGSGSYISRKVEELVFSVWGD